MFAQPLSFATPVAGIHMQQHCIPWYKLFGNVAETNYEDCFPKQGFSNRDADLAKLYGLCHCILLPQGGKHEVYGMLCT